MRIYTGVGSRKTPREYLASVREIAYRLGTLGWTLRSGAAEGADSAFEEGARLAGSPTEVYLPFRGFRGRQDGIVADRRLPAHKQAVEIAMRHHRNWTALRASVRALMVRNVFEVLGYDLKTPSSFLVCWSPSPVVSGDGRVVDCAGGTGQAVRIAATYGVPVFHLGLPQHANRVKVWLDGIDPALAGEPFPLGIEIGDGNGRLPHSNV